MNKHDKKAPIFKKYRQLITQLQVILTSFSNVINVLPRLTQRSQGKMIITVSIYEKIMSRYLGKKGVGLGSNREISLRAGVMSGDRKGILDQFFYLFVSCVLMMA